MAKDGGVVPLIVLGALLASAAPAGATIAPTLHDPSNCTERTAGALDYWFCDDGLPSAGGTTANVGGAKAVTVPANYGADGYTGLPPKGAEAAAVPGADPATGDVALDVDLSLPRSAPPPGGYPLVAMMHGCCSGDKTGWEADSFEAGGERWHYSNAWFASRGYAVLTYTARGFVDGQNRGSSGQTQLDSRSFEINDFQHLACQVLGSISSFDDVNVQANQIDPNGVVVTGGSYGGGFSWMALTDPKWTCTGDTGAGGTAMKLAAAAPKYGWTDLVYSLTPTGTHFQDPGRLPATDGCDSGPKQLDGTDCAPPDPVNPVGMPKSSINNGLYLSGKAGLPPSFKHTTFPPEIDEAFACTTGAYPPEGNPLCAGIEQTLVDFLNERSAYYQNHFFSSIAGDPSFRIPVFNAATFTDPLFTPVENRRMLNRLRSVVPDYPIQAYHGDLQHFVQSKAKEWGDICGDDHHVCKDSDYPNGGATPSDLNSNPTNRVRTGITTRLNRFIDHYAKPGANQSEPQPSFDVTVSLQVCPQNAAALGVGADEPGPTFTAATFEELAPNVLSVTMPGTQTTTSQAADTHSGNADPVQNLLANGGRCPAEATPGGPGVATYGSESLDSPWTMIGATTVEIDYSATGDPMTSGLQLNARLYDVFPDGRSVMVDRGVRRVTAAKGAVSFQLHGNGWRFEKGHRIRVEIAQDDDPFVKSSSVPSSATLTRVQLRIPVREGGSSGGGGGGGGGGGVTEVGGGPELLEGRCKNLQLGTGDDDRLTGTRKGDRLNGRGGDDVLEGRGEGDCLAGARGDDELGAGKGEDELAGARGEDELDGGPGKDELSGGRGPDRLMASGGGRDVVRCGGGHDLATADREDELHGCESVSRGRR